MRIFLGSFVTALLLMIQTINAQFFDGFPVSLCCLQDQVLINGECSDMTEWELNEIDFSVDVTLKNGLLVKKYLNQQWNTPMSCETTNMFYMDNKTETYGYTLFEDGTLLRHYDKVAMSRWEYCIQPQLLEDGSIRVVPHICEASKTGQTVVMIISMICLLLTISVYLLVKKLRDLIGKCFICYMGCLFMGYLFLLYDLWELSKGFCMTAGFLGYFFIISAFLWLNVISVNFYNEFRGTPSKLRFLVFWTYVWGTAVVLTGITFLANKLVEIDYLNPRVGKDDHCWIYTQDWSAMIYFYGPLLLIIVINVIMFIMTVIHMIEMNYNLEHNRKVDPSPIVKDFAFIPRLFIIMGVSWTFEIVSYLLKGNQFWKNVFLVSDYFHWSQGTIIFVMFILNGSTIKLLKERITGKDEKMEVPKSEIAQKDTKSYQRVP
ncbi:G-protein coupled receptor Mth-like [Drosophila subpulchrella]|uniref:G-protein coupled receptor Mth-like n=1 Tax=Drosophila subpulchrella TaxID=1486046 RepID=UPI0018A131ED|nr:G-protein coupled receptor Mth-like [Drosophila subpulchrella]